jgi:hypothetical protein
MEVNPMTHAEAIAQSRRALDHRDDCHRDLVELGPDTLLKGCTWWSCSRCEIAISIDPTGIIRDTIPGSMLGDRVGLPRRPANDPGVEHDGENYCP